MRMGRDCAPGLARSPQARPRGSPSPTLSSPSQSSAMGILFLAHVLALAHAHIPPVRPRDSPGRTARPCARAVGAIHASPATIAPHTTRASRQPKSPRPHLGGRGPSAARGATTIRPSRAFARPLGPHCQVHLAPSRWGMLRTPVWRDEDPRALTGASRGRLVRPSESGRGSPPGSGVSPWSVSAAALAACAPLSATPERAPGISPSQPLRAC